MTPTLTMSVPVREIGASLAVALGFGVVGATTTTSVDQLTPLSTRTSTARQYDLDSPRAVAAGWLSGSGTAFTPAGVNESQAPTIGEKVPPADQINSIRSLSGLTNDQIGRLFGVSRRSIHNWLNGNPMSLRHEVRATQILQVLQAVPGTLPAERRAALLDSSRGKSLFHQLVARPHEPVHSADLSVTERLGL